LGDFSEFLEPSDFKLMLVVEILGLLEPLRRVVLPADGRRSERLGLGSDVKFGFRAIALKNSAALLRLGGRLKLLFCICI